MDSAENRYLVQFGRSAFVAAFSTPETLRRNDDVVIQTVRGLEVGTILCAAKSNDVVLGSIVRVVNDADRQLQMQCDQLSQRVLADANERNTDPVVFADVESTLDGLVLLHVLPIDACDLSPLLARWSEQFQVRVSLVDLSSKQTVPDAPDAQDGNCGKPNCGEGNCSTTGGCSTGSCSRGAVKDAAELTDYFQSLRKQMESDRRVTLN